MRPMDQAFVLVKDDRVVFQLSGRRLGSSRPGSVEYGATLLSSNRGIWRASSSTHAARGRYASCYTAREVRAAFLLDPISRRHVAGNLSPGVVLGADEVTDAFGLLLGFSSNDAKKRDVSQGKGPVMKYPVRDAGKAKGVKGPVGPKWLASKEQQPLAEVNLNAPDGFLWQPTSIMPPSCEGGKQTGKEMTCEAKVNFCLIKIREYQETPWTYPMSAMLQKGSECTKAENRRLYKLSTLREYLHEHPDEFLYPTGFIFHETRTGSTLVANMLAHVPSNLVMSEHSLAEAGRLCKNCTREQKVALIRELLLLLGTAKAGHEYSFFKFQDATSIDLLTEAFPDVPWVFLFREPVEVMVSNLKGAFGKRKRLYKDFDFDAVNSTDPDIDKPERAGKFFMSPCLVGSMFADKAKADKEVVCATRLKRLCEAAVEGIAAEKAATVINSARDEKRSLGAVVEYTNLPDVVMGFLYPHHFGMGSELLEKHAPYLSVAASMYSKSMSNAPSNFELGMDAGYKKVMAEKAYRNAAETTGLTEVYHTLQGLQTWKSQD